MTEQEWLTCTDPQKMLEFLRGKASHRKLRLMLCGWSRLNWKWLAEEVRSSVEIAELFADGLSSDAEREADDVRLWQDSQERHVSIRHWHARLTLVPEIDLWAAVSGSVRLNPVERVRQPAIVMDIFGNPFHPVAINPAWLAWNDGTVQKIALGIYEQRAFDRLPILADALEEAGCQDQDILTHCRQAGEHVRGCWVVDAVLGKK